MIQTTDEIPAPSLASMISWLVDMGVDELLEDTALDRFVVKAEVPQPSPLQAPKTLSLLRPAPVAPTPSAGLEGLPAAEALAASIVTLEDYLAAVNGFEAHPLRKTASRACVLGGNLGADLLVLCDKPRNEEDRTGLVLAGNNQVLAARMLAAIGLKAFSDDPAQDHVAVANLIPWRPPGNRNPTDLEVRLLVPLVERMVALLKPRAILCFGHLPGQYLADGEDAIGRARGRWLTLNGTPLLTTFHPDTLLKSPASKRLAWTDLQNFRDKLETLS